ncbi:MAG: ATP-binding protein [Candidatus Competibacteraceae bacterium]|nr:ATP-binding protein [Candidatus Competibacteraceae bacterium]
MADNFDLDNERLIVASGIRNIFTPYQPVMDRDLFFGRQAEVAGIIQQLNTPGQHSLLFGERGVGKSSLANIASEVLKPLAGDSRIVKRCDSTDNFRTIVEPLLREVGIDLQIKSTADAISEGGDAGLNAGFAKAGVKTTTTHTQQSDGVTGKAESPGWVADQVRGLEALFLLDEIDVIAPLEKAKIAEFVKQLSDSGSKLKLLIVGIADTAVELTNGHPSVQRALRETRLRKMSDREIEFLVTSGAEKAKIEFKPSAIRKIVTVSAGYPHFAHLLALKAAEIVIGSGEKEVQLFHIQQATNAATGDAEGTLRAKYDEFVRSANTDEFRRILVAATAIDADEFPAAMLRQRYRDLWGREVTQGWLNNYLQKIVANDDSCILRRLAKGIYKFADLRMRSYVRLANLSDVPDDDDG